jgi:DNA processing protein
MESANSGNYLRLLNAGTISVSAFSKLLKEFRSMKALRKCPRSVFEKLGFNNAQINLLQEETNQNELDRNTGLALEWATEDSNHLISYESPFYPSLLREIDVPPPLLYVRGLLASLQASHFAIVGSRKATIAGKKNAFWMAQELSRAGLQVCSGLASGIDSRAHDGALNSGAKTLAVIGTGIDRVYPPQNRKLAEQIVECGALVSEFPMGTPPLAHNFPRRNRIISGVASGILVVEASTKSGSLISARLAMEQNRDVFAIPGPIANPQSRGCHYLIKQGAKLVEEPADILEELGFLNRRSTAQVDINSDQKRDQRQVTTNGLDSDCEALKAIDQQGCLFEAILGECHLDIQELNRQLVKLEAEGLIRQLGGRYFRLN